MFTHAPRDKLLKEATPHLAHNYWKERVYEESKSRESKRNKSLIVQNSMIRSYQMSPHNRKWNQKLIDENTVNLFTDFIHSKARFDIDVELPKRVKPTTAINWKRINNGGHIPRLQSGTKGGYLDMFAKRSYIKPHQLAEDSKEIENLIDDIRTDPRLTFSRKKEKINRVLKQYS
jgi:hypothetical protein